MPLWNLTYEKVEDIKTKRSEKEIELKILESTPI